MKVGQAEATFGTAFFNAMVPLGENAEFYSFGGVSSRDGRAGAFYRLPDQEAQVVPQIFPYGMLPYINTGITDQSIGAGVRGTSRGWRSEEHTSELQSQSNLVCRLLLEKKKKINRQLYTRLGSAVGARW